MHQKECAALPKQPTPRKGTETPDQILVSGVDLETTHTPQGDGNLFRIINVTSIRRNNPHPARGRKPMTSTSSAFRAETTHTPQGDGNPDRLNWWIPGRRNNPHPARGRKLRLCCSGAIVDRNNPHPARGRKLFALNMCHQNSTKQPTPRKGTETTAGRGILRI